MALSPNFPTLQRLRDLSSVVGVVVQHVGKEPDLWDRPKYIEREG